MWQHIAVVKNQRVISPHLSSLMPHSISKLLEDLHMECMINIGPFRYNFKLDDTPDVKKAGQHCFVFGL
jgi:hypothetical protein